MSSLFPSAEALLAQQPVADIVSYTIDSLSHKEPAVNVMGYAEFNRFWSHVEKEGLADPMHDPLRPIRELRRVLTDPDILVQGIVNATAEQRGHEPFQSDFVVNGAFIRSSLGLAVRTEGVAHSEVQNMSQPVALEIVDGKVQKLGLLCRPNPFGDAPVLVRFERFSNQLIQGMRLFEGSIPFNPSDMWFSRAMILREGPALPKDLTAEAQLQSILGDSKRAEPLPRVRSDEMKVYEAPPQMEVIRNCINLYSSKEHRAAEYAGIESLDGEYGSKKLIEFFNDYVALSAEKVGIDPQAFVNKHGIGLQTEYLANIEDSQAPTGLLRISDRDWQRIVNNELRIPCEEVYKDHIREIYVLRNAILLRACRDDASRYVKVGLLDQAKMETGQDEEPKVMNWADQFKKVIAGQYYAN